MTSLSLQHIYKVYENGFQAVKDISFEAESGELLVLAGPAGCGKSTILHMISGLDTISEGELYINGKQMNHANPQQRAVAAICGNAAMYPGQTVYENLAFNLKLSGLSEIEIEKRVHTAAGLLNMRDILEEDSGTLCDKEKQSIVFGRAVVKNPEIYLLDEPLSGLDSEQWEQVKKEIRKLHETMGKTMIYATRNPSDALELGSRIIILKDGTIQQIGTAEDLCEKPANEFVAGYVGSSSI